MQLREPLQLHGSLMRGCCYYRQIRQYFLYYSLIHYIFYIFWSMSYLIYYNHNSNTDIIQQPKYSQYQIQIIRAKPMHSTPNKQRQPKQCPYLSTIRKNLLDFDFQKICSITLTHTNIYICLICGRYFQGRSSTSPAYQHSIQFQHFIFMNLDNSRVFCLPDDYQVESFTLLDVKDNLKPRYDLERLEELEKIQEKQYNVDGKEFWPGVIGVNNLGKTDFAAAIVYMLNSIKEVRRFFVLNNHFEDKLASEFSIILKKIWNPKSFKGVVSPHQFLQAITDVSSKKFKMGTQSDPATFFLWLIDNLTKGLKKNQPKLDLQRLFRGTLKTSIIHGIKDSYEYEQIPSKIENINFLTLRLEFPEKGIFNKSQNEVHLSNLLEKYTGKQPEKHQKGLRYAKIIEFPSYLVLIFKRFTNNGFSVEKDNSCLLFKTEIVIESDGKKSVYRLQGQVCHTGEYETGRYKAIVYMEDANKWFEIQDLEAKQMAQKQVLVCQPYIQIYKLLKITQSKLKQKQKQKQKQKTNQNRAD